MTNPTIDPISYNAGIEAAETQPAEHVARFWDLLRNNHVRILVDMRREVGHDAPDGPSVYWDGSSFGDDTARMLLAEHDRSLHRTEPQTAPDDEAKRFRTWPHDEPNGWNLNAARFVELLQSQPMMWLRLTRAKYIEMRIDTRDGGFNLYDRDRQPLEPDEVVAAITEATEKYGAGLYRPSDAAPADAERLALAGMADEFCQSAFGPFGVDVSSYSAIVFDLLQKALAIRAGGRREDNRMNRTTP